MAPDEYAQYYKDLLAVSAIEKEEQAAEERRRIRDYTVDIEEIRGEGQQGSGTSQAPQTPSLQSYETFIPSRMVKRGIESDVPGYVKRLNAAHQLVVLSQAEDPFVESNSESTLFTKLVRYDGWLIPWVRFIDATSLHGGACMEVIVDTSKPAFFRLEFFHRHRLLCAKDAMTLEEQKCIARRFYYPQHILETYAERGKFSKSLVAKITSEERKGPKDPSRRIPVDKVFFRDGDEVLVGLRHPDYVDEWLSVNAPTPLSSSYKVMSKHASDFMRLSPSPEDSLKFLPFSSPTNFPVVYMPYNLTEIEELFASKGRAFEDAPAQELVSNLWSAIVNKAVKAAQVYGSAAGQADSAEIEETVPLQPDRIVKAPVNFWSPQMPDPQLVQIAQILEAKQNRSLGRQDLASMAKTGVNVSASEINAAISTSDEFALNKTVPFAMAVRQVYEIGFNIFQYNTYKRVLSNQLPPYMSPELAATFLKPYVVLNGGIADLQQKQQTAMSIMQILPQFAQNSQITAYLQKRLIEIIFPEMSEDINNLYQQENKTLELLQKALTLLANVPATSPQYKQLADAFLQGVGQQLSGDSSNANRPRSQPGNQPVQPNRQPRGDQPTGAGAENRGTGAQTPQQNPAQGVNG